ncbi:hypothetical protein ANO11243_078980 [Dothideomycetidae sp. 11243]|nr:hypothetical protein ANO11243_078980 [fungal sp. No.11243]
MPEKQLTHMSLEALQNEDARELMDTVDRLRKAGLGAVVQLPQIVTVGDQSSGKSSTLEAITGNPFPRKENLCTRFATQIVLRRASVESVSVAIIPDKLRPEEERERLEQLRLTLQDFSKLEELVDEATEAMGLTSLGQNVTKASKASKHDTRAFARDVLTIEISGPTRPHLTLVDLPGLIHSSTKTQSPEDVELIRHLAGEYMKEKRTIILAVVSAKNDYANQIVLSKARDLKAEDRTLGIITKVDALRAGSADETSWINLAQNMDVYFTLGWHMLRNRSPEEMSSSLAKRDEEEARFFSRGKYCELDRDMLGIQSLRQRLSILLSRHLTEELPGLQKEVDDMHKETAAQLQRLGQTRSTVKEQRHFLLELGQKFERIATSAMSGNYDDSFFSIDAKKTVTDEANICRLRAAVQYANKDFSDHMHQYGAKYHIIDFTGSHNHDSIRRNEAQEEISFEEAVDWVRNIIERSRGQELTGNFNPSVIGQLFWEHSQPWEMLATAHVDRIASYCTMFVERLLQSITTPDVSKKITSLIVVQSLLRRKQKAHQVLQEIFQDKARQPITYNHYYTDVVQRMRKEKHEKKLFKALDLDNKANADSGEDLDDPLVRLSAVRSCIADYSVVEDMEAFSAEDALTCVLAFYKDELKFFVDCVAKQVIERSLIKGLATEIISAVVFGNMDDKQISSLAKEPSSTTALRRQLTRKLAMLEEEPCGLRSAPGCWQRSGTVWTRKSIGKYDKMRHEGGWISESS